MKTIYFEPAGRIHPSQWTIINNPPEGYRFITPKPRILDKYIIQNDIVFSKVRLQLLDRLLPLNITMSYINYMTKLPKGIDLIYSYNHPIVKKIPWVCQVEWFNVLIGRDPRWLNILHEVTENLLNSNYCKKLLFWTSVAKNTFLKEFEDFPLEKIGVLPHCTLPKRTLPKELTSEYTYLLFVGSMDDLDDFKYKGGPYLLKAYDNLRDSYNIRLIIKARVPKEVKEEYLFDSNILFIDRIVSKVEMDHIWGLGDIFVFPTHLTHNTVVIEAMSWGLPVITTYSGSSFLKYISNINGSIIPNSLNSPLLDSRTNLLVSETTNRTKILKEEIDLKVVDNLTREIEHLITNKEERYNIGKTNLLECTTGKFSVENRNKKLKEIFYAALE